MTIVHYYRSTPAPHGLLTSLQAVDPAVTAVRTEQCFNVEIQGSVDTAKLEWLLRETFDQEGLTLERSQLGGAGGVVVLEFGPRMTFTSAFSSNAVGVCHACGLTGVVRLERSRRYALTGVSEGATLAPFLHDRMTEEEYPTPLTSFDAGVATEPVVIVPIMEEGRDALERINETRGLGFDDFDLDYYTDLFQSKLGRNPTDVECFDMGQSNSEHSRHWFFGGKMVIDGETKPHTLFQMVKATLPADDKSDNSIIAFHDNSSSIRGYDDCRSVVPDEFGKSSAMRVKTRTLHPILTAETHNFPCGVAPFPGAETGTGGRLRDVMATGRGAYTCAGVSSYCVGNLLIPGHEAPWETKGEIYPPNLASPLSILVEASNGASDYGNKFGEPVVHGFARSYGDRSPNGERFEWVKPIMFSAGIGMLDGGHTAKFEPEVGMLVVKVGGPAYRIGIGGGAASSRVQSEGNAALDFDAVQRGDAEMENRLMRLMRSCCDLEDQNPIVSCHDQGAGGNGNVLKEIVEGAGARYDVRKVYVGDKTLSVLEIWGAEYQENNALLIRPESEKLFHSLATRENCPYRILGHVTGDGRVVLEDSADGTTPVDLPLDLVLGKMPQKTFVDNTVRMELQELTLPAATTVTDVVNRVLRLLSVGSKRFLVHKVDRSVSGLVAQQQCVGPLQLPLANCAVTAHTHFSNTGTVVACGESPIKGLVSPAAMARMVVAESMTNLVWAKWSRIEDIKSSANWMYAAKLPGEGAKMYEACEALRDSLLSLGAGIDGGKDSLSMAARCGDEVVKAPGMLTLTCYVTSPDIGLTVTPDLKCGGRKETTKLLYIDLGNGKARTGGSALAQVYNQIGNVSPDVDDFAVLKNAILVTQELLDTKQILSGHDRSDGGLAVTLMEMAFAGNCSIDVTVPQIAGADEITTLFHEESGLVLEVSEGDMKTVMGKYTAMNVPCVEIGTASPGDSIKVSVGSGSAPCIDEKMTVLRDIWEETSFQLEKRQRNPECVVQEEANLKTRKAPEWKLTYTPTPTEQAVMDTDNSKKHKVAIIRQEGSNGDREMISAFMAAGFEAWDVTVSDLLEGNVTLEKFRGIVFVGGFSYADVLDSGKGWAGVIRFNEGILKQFEAFRNRKDTFSLGICNGCQLMALLGWVPCGEGLEKEENQPRLMENESERFESRFSSVKIEPSPAVMFKGMEGSSLGVWVAHGEGRVHFPDQAIYDKVIAENLSPLRYVNDSNEITQEYPFNPNGSPDGMAALCSEDGRHLAMMPHPERVFLTWQWPWIPEEWKGFQAGPWLKMFQNAREFCDSC